MNYYLDRIDTLINLYIKKGVISFSEGCAMQSIAYNHDNLKAGLNWLAKKLDSLD